MPIKEKSNVYDFLARVVKHWDRIPIRVFEDGNWKDLFLSEIKSDREIANWITTTLSRDTYGKR